MARLRDNLAPGMTADITWNGKQDCATMTVRVAWWAWPGIIASYLRMVRAPWWTYALIPWLWYHAATRQEAPDA
jgi:hypothetical protein